LVADAAAIAGVNAPVERMTRQRQKARRLHDSDYASVPVGVIVAQVVFDARVDLVLQLLELAGRERIS
jgi:hypothetical protein